MMPGGEGALLCPVSHYAFSEDVPGPWGEFENTFCTYFL